MSKEILFIQISYKTFENKLRILANIKNKCVRLASLLKRRI